MQTVELVDRRMKLAVLQYSVKSLPVTSLLKKLPTTAVCISEFGYEVVVKGSSEEFTSRLMTD